MKLDINLIWAVVVLIVAGIAGAYSLNKQKLEKLKLIHPKLATVLETAGELALKATTYQASLDGKEGNRKLADATDEVYDQMLKLYPNVPISKDTIRNYVQHMYDTKIKDTTTAAQVEEPKKATIVEPIKVEEHE
ncbi:holin [Lactobacillus johnsonii]|uniref:holin n=1 Tax=Lactobacillus johnsonii TaxID=33959 RepID=UPI00201AF631|nr:holin [Lactobacillus johnsonii]MCL5444288.1 holin [Lactobacillus johnsonii]